MNKKVESLKKKQKLLKEQICNNLDLLIGTIRKSPAMRQHSLTMKVDGKTVSRYVRKGLIVKAKKMTQSHKKVRELINKLSQVNWQLLKLESE